MKNLATLALVATLTACAASNPPRTNVPAPWQPPAKTAPDPAKPTDPKSADPTPADTKTNPPAGASTTTAASTDTPTKSGDAAKPAAAEEPVILRVGGEPVYVSELLVDWLYDENSGALEKVEQLVIDRLVYLEAQRLRVRISTDEGLSTYEEYIKDVETKLAKKYPGMTLDRYIERGLGLTASRYRDRIRRLANSFLLAKRVARAWLLQQEHVSTHAIITENEDDMKAVQKELADGADFEEVAKKRSVDKSSKDEGGRLTPIVDRDSALGKLAFATEVGKLGGPKMTSGAWLLIRVDARTQPITGDWSQIGPAVEASLKERPVDENEVQQWRRAMFDRYEVDMRPFFALVREPH